MNINILINNLILMHIFSSSKFMAPKYRVHFVKYKLIFSVYLLICVGVEPI